MVNITEIPTLRRLRKKDFKNSYTASSPWARAYLEQPQIYMSRIRNENLIA